MREAFAAEHLQRQGFQVYFPRQTRVVRHARRCEQRQVSYFPGYIFVSLDLARDRWRAVNGTLGVRSLVMSGDAPAITPDGLVEDLQRACAAGSLVGLRPGETVRLVSGPFAEVLGVIDRLDAGGRVRVLLDIIGGLRPVVTTRADLALAS
jgi:transcription antitermination factor NusG